MLAEEVICAGSSFGSGEFVSDPSVIEQPPSAIAADAIVASAIVADARGMWRKFPEKGTGTVIERDTHALTRQVVARSAAKCIGQIASTFTGQGHINNNAGQAARVEEFMSES